MGDAHDGYRQPPLEGGPDEQLRGELGEGVAVGARGFEVRGQGAHGIEAEGVLRPGGPQGEDGARGDAVDGGAAAEGEPQHFPGSADVGGLEVAVGGEDVEVGGEVEDGVGFFSKGGEGIRGEPHQRFRQVAWNRLQALVRIAPGQAAPLMPLQRLCHAPARAAAAVGPDQGHHLNRGRPQQCVHQGRPEETGRSGHQDGPWRSPRFRANRSRGVDLQFGRAPLCPAL